MSIVACSVADETHSPGRLYKGMCSKHHARVKKYGTPFPNHIARCGSCESEFASQNLARKYCDTCRSVGDAGYRERAIEDLAPTRRMRCANCGAWMHKSSSSLPEGVAKCLECRRLHDGIVAKGGCKCAPCREAKAAYMRRYKEDYRAVHGIGPASMVKRKFRAANGFSYVTGSSVPISNRRAVYERDQWTCQICLEAIPRDCEPLSLLRASVDHIVPRSKQLVPDHSVSALRMVHFICNALRADERITDEQVRALNPTLKYS